VRTAKLRTLKAVCTAFVDNLTDENLKTRLLRYPALVAPKACLASADSSSTLLCFCSDNYFMRSSRVVQRHAQVQNCAF
jgi:hypothetical protein